MSEQAAQSRPWTATETAEDLLAQVEDALVAGWSEAELLAAFDNEGVDGVTAALVLDDVRRDAAAAGGPSSSGRHEHVSIALTAARQFIRQRHDPLTLSHEHQRALATALTTAGLRATTAEALLADLTALERRMAEVYHRRMRRLGLQGMVVGGATSVLFVFGGLFGGDGARWHLITAALTLALFAYSLQLWRRGRPPGK